MSSDRTEILVRRSMMGDDLTPEEADVVASRLEDNTRAMHRFMAIEEQIGEILIVIHRVKSAGKWVITFLIANYGLTFRESIESVIMGIVK